MMVERFSRSHRLHARLRSEAAFLPKRLVLVALLLFALYLALLLRTGHSDRYVHLGFVEVSLKSKLSADYDLVGQPAVSFAPLHLALIKAKIQDENPYLPANEVDALVQRAMAAAAAPIVTATPTALPSLPRVVQSAVVISASLAWHDPLLSHAAGLPEQHSSAGVFAPVSTHFSAKTVRSTVDATALHTNGLNDAAPLTGVAGTSTPSQALPAFTNAPLPSLDVTAIVVTAEAGTPAWGGEGWPSGHAIVTTFPGAGLPTADALPTKALPAGLNTPTDITLPSTHLAAAQPGLADLSTATPTAVASIVGAVTVTSLPSATWTALPTSTPVPTWTVTPLPTVTGSPTNANLQPPATATPLVLPPVTATAVAVTPSVTAVNTAVATAVVATPTPVPSATATLPQMPKVTPTVTASLLPTSMPVIDRLTAYVQDDKVYLEWPPAVVTGIVGYNLYRGSATNAEGERMNVEPLQDVTYVDTVALDGNQYFYRVTAVDLRAQESLPSEAVTVTIKDRKPPHTPSNFLVHLSGDQVHLQWEANTELDLAGYNIYRGTALPVDRTSGALNGALPITVPTYVDTVLLTGQSYYYVFTAVDWAGNESPPSIEAQIPTINAAVPAAPSGLTAIFLEDDDQDDDEDNEDEVKLRWLASQEADVVGYRLYRSLTLPVDTTTAPLHKKPLLTGTHYHDEDLVRGQTYYYVVVAVDREQYVSLPSAVVMLTVPP